MLLKVEKDLQPNTYLLTQEERVQVNAELSAQRSHPRTKVCLMSSSCCELLNDLFKKDL